REVSDADTSAAGAERALDRHARSVDRPDSLSSRSSLLGVAPGLDELLGLFSLLIHEPDDPVAQVARQRVARPHHDPDERDADTDDREGLGAQDAQGILSIERGPPGDDRDDESEDGQADAPP